MKYAEWIRRARGDTAPGQAALARVRARLDRQLVPATAELASVPGPRPGAVGRVKARLQARPAPSPWPARLASATLLATAAVLAISLVDGGAAAERRIALGGDSAGALALTDHVRVEHQGRGHVVAAGDEVVIDWEIGRLLLDVDPETGSTVEVKTAEGTVRVVGTRFSVERDALGTRVDVERGAVAVTCADGTVRELAPSETLECEPVTAAALLNRARTLEQRRAGSAPILATVERGLADPDGSDAVRAELFAARANALVGDGRNVEALAAAEAALSGAPDPVRAVSLHRLAARLALIGGDCARALPHLDALPSLTAEEEAHRARCR